MSLRSLLNMTEAKQQVYPPTNSGMKQIKPDSLLRSEFQNNNILSKRTFDDIEQVEDDDILEQDVQKKIKSENGKEVQIKQKDEALTKPVRELKYIGYPVKLTPKPRCKKRYAVEVRWIEGGRERHKHVRFGKGNASDFIDDHDEKKRNTKLKKMTITDDFTSPAFYTAYLLNSPEHKLKEAWGRLVEKLGLDQ